MQKLKNEKGITLVALVITIIIMLILVGVSVTVALRGELFNTAKHAKEETENGIEAELVLADGRIKVGGKWYLSYEKYLSGDSITVGMELSQRTINLKKNGEGEEEEEVLTGTITAKPFGTEEEPEITWEVLPKEQTAISLSSTTGRTITVTATGTESTRVELIAKFTYNEVTYTEKCIVDLEIMVVPETYKKNIEGLQEGVTVISYSKLETQASPAIKEAVDNGKISAVLQETITLNGVTAPVIAVVPTGFELSTTDIEDSISEGLVIKEEENEFVWVPVSNYKSYTDNSFGPITEDYVVDGTTIGDYDSYQTIQYLYGDALGEITDETSFNTTFSYETDKAKIEQSIRTYGGFYVGRYETTFNSKNDDGVAQEIGVKRGKNVLERK